MLHAGALATPTARQIINRCLLYTKKTYPKSNLPYSDIELDLSSISDHWSLEWPVWLLLLRETFIFLLSSMLRGSSLMIPLTSWDLGGVCLPQLKELLGPIPPHAHATHGTIAVLIMFTKMNHHVTSCGQDLSIPHAVNTICILAWHHTAFIQIEHLFHLLSAHPQLFYSLSLQVPVTLKYVDWPGLHSCLGVLNCFFSFHSRSLTPIGGALLRAHFSRHKNHPKSIIISEPWNIPPALPGYVHPWFETLNWPCDQENGGAPETFWP